MSLENQNFHLGLFVEGGVLHICMWIAFSMLKWCFDKIHEFLSYDWEHVDWEMIYVTHVLMKV